MINRRKEINSAKPEKTALIHLICRVFCAGVNKIDSSPIRQQSNIEVKNGKLAYCMDIICSPQRRI
jgi:hypothetical protein